MQLAHPLSTILSSVDRTKLSWIYKVVFFHYKTTLSKQLLQYLEEVAQNGKFFMMVNFFFLSV